MPPIDKIDTSGNLPRIIKKILNTVKGLISSAAFKLLTIADWPGVIGLVSRIAMTIKAISNYKSNRKKEDKLQFKDGYIDNQYELSGWRLGLEYLSKCGCEVISVYNVLKACGKTHKLSELILYFEMCGYVMLYGYFGSNPTKLWKTFALLTINFYSSFTFSTIEDKLKKSRCGIVSCWNGKITKGLHTFMVKYDRKQKVFTAYNGYKTGEKNINPSKSLKDMVYSSKFIIGYSIE